jgi:hypothetical protein
MRSRCVNCAAFTVERVEKDGRAGPAHRSRRVPGRCDWTPFRRRVIVEL